MLWFFPKNQPKKIFDTCKVWSLNYFHPLSILALPLSIYTLDKMRQSAGKFYGLNATSRKSFWVFSFLFLTNGRILRKCAVWQDIFMRYRSPDMTSMETSWSNPADILFCCHSILSLYRFEDIVNCRHSNVGIEYYVREF